jgi:hypothetical protein
VIALAKSLTFFIILMLAKVMIKFDTINMMNFAKELKMRIWPLARDIKP